MVTPDAPVKLHRIMNDQIYHYYLGDLIELRLLYQSGATQKKQKPDNKKGRPEAALASLDCHCPA